MSSEIVMLSIVAGLLGLVLALVIMRMSILANKLDEKISNMSTDLDLNEDFKQQLYDLLTMALDDTVGNMQLPTAKDHVFGALSSLLMSRLTPNLPDNLIKDGIESIENYGQAKE